MIDPITYLPKTDLAPTGRPWPRGFRNGNPGNFDYVPSIKWQGQLGIEPRPIDGKRPRFARFKSAVWGLRAIFRDLITGYDRDGEDTIQAIITEWAPPNENNTQAYIDQVCKATGFKADQKLNLHLYEHAVPLAKAIVRHENDNPRLWGLTEWYPDEAWDEAASRAGLLRTAPKPVARDPELVAGGAAAVAGTISVADGLGLVKQYVEPGSTAAHVVGVLAVVGVLYLIARRWRRRKREAA
jgi:hypothetical protein